MKKLIFIGAAIICLIIIVIACSQKRKETTPAHTRNRKILIVEYGDYKCPYYKKIENNVMPIVKKGYIDTNKVEYQFINASFLGKDSLMGSRAGNAIQAIAPKEYLTFQKNIYAHQQDEKKHWITETLLDKEINQLDISQKQKDRIKKGYKTKNSDTWKEAEKQKKLTKESHVQSVPTVFINGKKVKDPYKIKEWKKYL